jgi:DNA repair protein RecO (recombination protein O)
MATNDAGLKSRRGAPLGELSAELSDKRPGGGRPSPLLQAYVLHRWDWSESSLIVELFTRERGRVVVVAKGAKRPTSNFRAVLLPFHPLHLQLGKAPADESGEVHALRSAEWAGGMPALPGAALFSGFYSSELVMKLLARDDAHPALFDAYTATLRALAAGADEAPVLRAFELALLRETGVLPDLSADTLTAQPVQPQSRYALQAQTGLVASPRGLPGDAWWALDAALAQKDWPALQTACAVAGAALRVPLREVLHYHLGAAPLRTRQVWQGVQRLSQRVLSTAVPVPELAPLPTLAPTHESSDRP